MKKYKQLKKSLTKEQRKELDRQILFLRTAMVSSMSHLIDHAYQEFTDNNGWIPIYEMMIEICDKVLFGDESEFLVYFEQWFKENKEESDIWYYWEDKHSTCYDWYFMDKANELVKEELKGYEKAEEEDK